MSVWLCQVSWVPQLERTEAGTRVPSLTPSLMYLAYPLFPLCPCQLSFLTFMGSPRDCGFVSSIVHSLTSRWLLHCIVNVIYHNFFFSSCCRLYDPIMSLLRSPQQHTNTKKNVTYLLCLTSCFALFCAASCERRGGGS